MRQLNLFKTCPKCGQTFPATTEYFHRYARTHDGLQGWCKICAATAGRIWCDTHKEQITTYRRVYREAHKEEAATYRATHERAVKDRIWRQRNREYLTEYRRQHLRANPQLRLKETLACAIATSLRGRKAGRHWETLVGYTLAVLMCHLELLFQPGMTWENYGKWHVDHIRPISSFRYTSPDDPDFRKCWALSNLQPLWAHDNLSKGTKVT